jgi:hypothetical protein
LGTGDSAPPSPCPNCPSSPLPHVSTLHSAFAPASKYQLASCQDHNCMLHHRCAPRMEKAIVSLHDSEATSTTQEIQEELGSNVLRNSQEFGTGSVNTAESLILVHCTSTSWSRSLNLRRIEISTVLTRACLAHTLHSAAC